MLITNLTENIYYKFPRETLKDRTFEFFSKVFLRHSFKSEDEITRNIKDL